MKQTAKWFLVFAIVTVFSLSMASQSFADGSGNKQKAGTVTVGTKVKLLPGGTVKTETDVNLGGYGQFGGGGLASSEYKPSFGGGMGFFGEYSVLDYLAVGGLLDIEALDGQNYTALHLDATVRGYYTIKNNMVPYLKLGVGLVVAIPDMGDTTAGWDVQFMPGFMYVFDGVSVFNGIGVFAELGGQFSGWTYGNSGVDVDQTWLLAMLNIGVTGLF